MIDNLTIGKAAHAAGVGVETIRFYERKGLIDRPVKPATGGYRCYSLETVARIQFIRQAQEIGFSLREIDELLSLRANPSTDCAQVRDRARTKLCEVDRKMEQLRRIRQALESLIDACPGQGNLLKACSIIQSFEDADATLLKSTHSPTKETTS